MKIIRYQDPRSAVRYVFLKPGDTVTIEIDRIGALTNPVIAEEA